MEEQNPYRSPQSVVADAAGEGELAGRGARLGAAIIDAIIYLVILGPLMYAGGYWQAVMGAAAAGTSVPFTTTLMWMVIAFVVFVLVQGYPLSQTGQTWGKKLLSIKIVDLEGAKPPFGRLIGLRYLPIQVVSAIPFIGGLLTIVDVLFIFREDRRCVHDLIAGTRVVNAR